MFESDSKMVLLNLKAAKIDSTLKYNPSIFVVKDIHYPISTVRWGVDKGKVKIYFKDLETILNEKLPRFETAPLLNVEGHKLDMHILEVTNTYFRVAEWSFSIDSEKERERGYYTFDIWLASFD